MAKGRVCKCMEQVITHHYKHSVSVEMDHFIQLRLKDDVRVGSVNPYGRANTNSMNGCAVLESIRRPCSVVNKYFKQRYGASHPDHGQPDVLAMMGQPSQQPQVIYVQPQQMTYGGPGAAPPMGYPASGPPPTTVMVGGQVDLKQKKNKGEKKEKKDYGYAD
eukprot:gnl/Hemi2/6432_TR2202_c0_g1_i1.p1 gnl/Hemi2/6432_TR2202_c0_g1~~gnl/Hemi2/6432_TR2202_c0_g1_i1.p1  ORF type:complete len:162 (+),score=34.08 gnl/Hemi2/6432_TR2202_c0_g1_i1:221-706(+)